MFQCSMYSLFTSVKFRRDNFLNSQLTKSVPSREHLRTAGAQCSFIGTKLLPLTNDQVYIIMLVSKGDFMYEAYDYDDYKYFMEEDGCSVEPEQEPVSSDEYTPCRDCSGEDCICWDYYHGRQFFSEPPSGGRRQVFFYRNNENTLDKRLGLCYYAGKQRRKQ